MFSHLSRDFNIKLQSTADQAHFNFGLLFGNKQEIIKRTGIFVLLVLCLGK